MYVKRHAEDLPETAVFLSSQFICKESLCRDSHGTVQECHHRDHTSYDIHYPIVIDTEDFKYFP